MTNRQARTAQPRTWRGSPDGAVLIDNSWLAAQMLRLYILGGLANHLVLDEALAISIASRGARSAAKAEQE